MTLAPPTPPAPSVVRLDANGRIDEDVSCRKCGYNLRGLLPETVCPECATVVGRSLRGDYLRFADPAWVAQLFSGLNWIMYGVALGFLVGAAAGVLIAALKLPLLVITAIQVVFGIVGLVGYWKFSMPDPSGLGESDGLNARKLLRITQIAGLAALPVSVFSELLDPILQVMVGVLAGIIGIVGFFAIFIYARRIALRIPDEKIANSCRTLMWGFIITAGIFIASGIIGALSSSSGIAGGGGCLGGTLMLVLIILSLLTALRFRRALMKAATEARMSWAMGA